MLDKCNPLTGKDHAKAICLHVFFHQVAYQRAFTGFCEFNKLRFICYRANNPGVASAYNGLEYNRVT